MFLELKMYKLQWIKMYVVCRFHPTTYFLYPRNTNAPPPASLVHRQGIIRLSTATTKMYDRKGEIIINWMFIFNHVVVILPDGIILLEVNFARRQDHFSRLMRNHKYNAIASKQTSIPCIARKAHTRKIDFMYRCSWMQIDVSQSSFIERYFVMASNEKKNEKNIGMIKYVIHAQEPLTRISLCIAQNWWCSGTVWSTASSRRESKQKNCIVWFG